MAKSEEKKSAAPPEDAAAVQAEEEKPKVYKLRPNCRIALENGEFIEGGNTVPKKIAEGLSPTIWE